MNNVARVAQAMKQMPLIAILRGLLPENAEETGMTLVSAGFTLIEVPLNSPEPFKSIGILRNTLHQDIVVGAGTVLSAEDVKRLADVGGEIVVTPNTDPAVIRAALDAGMVPMPGFSTATEAFAAIAVGAQYIKLFPANTYPVDYVKALLSVLPNHINILAVGGVDQTNGAAYIAAGCSGLGLGSCLFKSGMTQGDIAASAGQLISIVGDV